MVVHLGVVIMAVAIVTSTSYTTRNEVTLATGQSTVVSGQYVTFNGFRTVKDSLETATQLRVDVDHHALLPAVTTYNGRSDQSVGTPAIDSNLERDVYVTFDAVGGNGNQSGGQVLQNLPSGAIALGVVVEPMIPWIWIGGLVVGLGGLLAVGARRRAPRRERVVATTATVAP